MSGSAGGEIVVLGIGAAAVGTVLLAAGLAYGAVRTTQFLLHTMDETWESHERIREVRRQEAALAAARYQVYVDARTDYDEVRALILSDVSAGADVDVPVEITALPADVPLDVLQDAIAELHSATAALRLERDAAATVHLARELAAALEHRSTSQARDASGDLAARAEELRQARSAAAAERDVQQQVIIERELAALQASAMADLDAHSRRQVQEALALVPADLDPSSREDLERLVAQVPTVTGESLVLTATAIEHVARAALTRSVERAQRRDTASAVITAMAGLASPAASEIARRAQAFLDGTALWDPELLDKARVEAERIGRQFADLAAAAALAASLEELGYVVGEDFVIEVTHGRTFAHRRDLTDHAVAVDFDGETGRLGLAVVRDGAPAATPAHLVADIEAESVLCHDIDRLEELAKEHGVEIDLDFREEPGSSGVEAVPDTGRRRPDVAARLKERSVPHD